MLTLNDVTENPSLLTRQVTLPGNVSAVIRPLMAEDVGKLPRFFAGLGTQTRGFYDVPENVRDHAQELCDAINRYDKLRLLLELAESREIIGLLAFSFDLVAGDRIRYASYGITLHPETDCRYGLCVRDDYHGRGCGSLLTRYAFEVASRFGQQWIILWGGVHSDNIAAIRHYQRHGFEPVGDFTNSDGVDCIDMVWTLEDV